MSGFMLLVGAMVILFIAYVTYGAWLAKQWGIDPSRKTPAHRLRDDVDLSLIHISEPTRPY